MLRGELADAILYATGRNDTQPDATRRNGRNAYKRTTEGGLTRQTRRDATYATVSGRGVPEVT